MAHMPRLPRVSELVLDLENELADLRARCRRHEDKLQQVEEDVDYLEDARHGHQRVIKKLEDDIEHLRHGNGAFKAEQKSLEKKAKEDKTEIDKLQLRYATVSKVPEECKG